MPDAHLWAEQSLSLSTYGMETMEWGGPSNKCRVCIASIWPQPQGLHALSSTRSETCGVRAHHLSCIYAGGRGMGRRHFLPAAMSQLA